MSILLEESLIISIHKNEEKEGMRNSHNLLVQESTTTLKNNLPVYGKGESGPHYTNPREMRIYIHKEAYARIFIPVSTLVVKSWK